MYNNKIYIVNIGDSRAIKDNSEDDEKIFRVYPSDLAVMRTIGDIKPKKNRWCYRNYY